MWSELAVANKLAALAGACLIGTATAAAAITGSFQTTDVETEPVELVETTVPDDDVETSTTEAEAAEDSTLVEPPVDEAGEPYGDVACDEAENHGEYVSGVAKDDSIEGNRGEIVSQAAKTDCGKNDKEERDADKAEDKADREAEKAEEKAERDADKAEEKAERDADKAEEKAERGSENGGGNKRDK